MAISEQHLAERRKHLVARCEVERVDLIERSAEVQGLLSAIDGTVHAVQRIKAHPGVVLGTLAAVLLIVRPKRVAALLGSMASASRTLQVIAPVVQGLRQRT